ncbi:helix-turn-helix transcriptional regulator [Microlunatus panaciterrae]|uniref:Transcriptional regulator with XRE-family HTH domain n=2 Tax=Microlunatus panaciterrae TaxID=400768 RepID=A0ABS2RFG0_9ACTN|nr:transcriptional regulator with XRE-family HTH domain [Microlunatus panaciterrae]
MSQTVLAELVGKTVSWIEKIESGRANLQVLPNIARLAEVLDIAPYELLPDDIVDVEALTRGRSVPALRQRLLSYRFVNPHYLSEESPPVSLDVLTQAVSGIWSAYQASRFGYVVAELHRLLPIASATAHASSDQAKQAAEVQMAYLYQVASCVLTKLGEQDLAFNCADRGDRLVQDSDDLGAKTSVQRSIAHALLSNAQYDDAMAVVEHTLRLIPAGTRDPRLISTLGTLHLVGAMTAARMKNRAAAQEHLGHAQIASVALGEDANYLWTAFGPTNVAIHRASVAAELGDYQRAAALGERIDVSPMPMERQVRHRLEVARALHFQRRQRDALALVMRAEASAPEQVRRHFLTHALLHDWLRSRHMAPSADLHSLARRAGVLVA